MTIQFLRQHLGFMPGAVISTYPPGICAELIRRGVAKPIDAASVVLKPAGKRKVRTK